LFLIFGAIAQLHPIIGRTYGGLFLGQGHTSSAPNFSMFIKIILVNHDHYP